MNRFQSILSVLLAAAVLSALSLGAFAAEKIKIQKLDDLPRHTYKIEMKAVELLQNDAALMKLAGEVKRDLEDILAKYEIEDAKTVQGFYATLGSIAFLQGDYDKYLDYLGKRRALEDKIPQRLAMGQFAESYVAAKKMGDANFKANLKAELAKRVESLPYADCEAILKQTKGTSEIMSENLVLGGIESTIQPMLDGSKGEMSRDVAEGLVGQAFTLRFFIPNKDVIHEVYAAVIDAHQTEKADIWAARDVELAKGDKASPVIMCVWDSGVDTDIYSKTGQMWSNTRETPGNNKDDDNNGFVDDVHGIAWSLHSDKEIPLLFPIGDISTDRPLLQKRMKGLEDIQSNIDSPEAQELRKMLATLPQDSVKPFIEGIAKYGNYCHGTHVAGIAVRGNPFARVLAARITFDYHMIPETPTIELAEKEAVAIAATIDYFKKNGVRVVNMSWGGSLKEIEDALEANNAGGTPEERKALARRIYEISYTALYEGIKNTPDILFITSAGNADANVVFEEYYPSSFDLPNIISVGAVDKAGDETGFTSFGKVDLYANGFEVMSYVPGGDEMALSGTSMSAPNAMNLAGKLLAKKPDLTVAQLRDLMIRACDEKKAGERTVRLMNPQRSMELLAEMK